MKARNVAWMKPKASKKNIETANISTEAASATASRLVSLSVSSLARRPSRRTTRANSHIQASTPRIPVSKIVSSHSLSRMIALSLATWWNPVTRVP